MSTFAYPVRIDWKNGDTIPLWNEKCARALEIFGLPGMRYITKVTEDGMDFIFIEEKDAVHFSLACL